jgi:AcrR family transcriptional regulator
VTPAKEAAASDDPVATRGRGVGVVHSGRAGGRAQGRTLRRQGEATLQRLFDAAVDVFALHGYHNATVDDIVTRSGMSRGTFYLYFDDKEDLVRALVLEVADDMTELAAGLGPIVAGAEGYEDLRAWLQAFSDLYRRHGTVIRVWTEGEVKGSELGDLSREMLGGFVAALAARIAEGGEAGIDHQIAGLVILSMIERLHFYAIAGLVDAGDGELVDTCAAIAHAALFGPAPRRPSSRKRPLPRAPAADM